MTTPGGDEVGEASVRIVPDTRGFVRDLRTDLNTIIPRVKSPKIKVVPDTTGFAKALRAQLTTATANIKPVKVKVVPDTTGFTTALRRQLASVRIPTVRVPVTPTATRGAGTGATGGPTPAQLNAQTVAQIRAAAQVRAAWLRAYGQIESARIRATTGSRTALSDMDRLHASALRMNAAFDTRRATGALRGPFDDLINGAGAATGAISGLARVIGTVAPNLARIGTGVGALFAVVQAAQLASRAIETVVSKTVELGVALSFKGLEGASTLQGLDLRFNAIRGQLGLGTESVHDFIQSLRDLELQTGLSIQSLSNSVTRFTGLGLTAREATSATLVFGDALATLGVNGALLDNTVASITTQLSQAAAVGKFAGDELKSVLENLGGTVTRAQLAAQIAKDTGQSLADVSKQLDVGGQLDFGTGFNALIEILADPNKGFVGGLERQAHLLPGVIRRIKKTFEQGLEDAFLPTLDKLAGQLEGFLTDNRAEIKEFGQGVADAFNQVAPEIIAALPSAMQAFSTSLEIITPLLRTAAEVTSDFLGFIDDHRETIIDLAGDIGTILGDSLQVFVPLIESAANTMGLWVPIIDAVAEAFRFAEPAIGPFGKAIATLLNPLDAFIFKIDLSLHAIEQLLDAVALIPEGIPIIGKISDGAGDAASKIHDLRMQLQGLQGSNKITVSTSIADTIKRQTKPVGKSALPKLPTLPSAVDESALREAEALARRVAEQIESIMEDLRDVTRDLTQKNAQEVLRTYQNLLDKIGDLFDTKGISGTKRVEKAFDGLIKKIDATVRAAGKLETVRNELDEAVKNVEQAAKIRDDFRDKVADSISETLNFGEISQEIEETGKQLTWLEQRIEDIRKRKAGVSLIADSSFSATALKMRKLLADTKEFSDGIKRLLDQGLNQVTGQQLLAKGVSSLPAVRELLAGGQGAVNELNSIQAEFDSIGRSLGNDASVVFFDAGVQAANGLIDGLVSQRDRLEAQMNKLGQQIAVGVKKALKIQSPSKIMIDIGKFVPLGLADGIQKASGQVAMAAKAMYEQIVPSRVSQLGTSSLAASSARTAATTAATTPARGVTGRDGNVINVNFEIKVSGVTSEAEGKRVGSSIGEAAMSVINERMAAAKLAGN